MPSNPSTPSRPPGAPQRPGTLGRNPAPGPGPGGRLADGFRSSAPALNLPKGGGAISGIGETFSANPVTGSASFSIPLPATPARGLAPSLALSYDSGAGNGPFGLGWQLGLPAIRRKTDKGLPRYLDDGPSADTFVLAGAEDLVPHLVQSAGAWIPVTRTVTDADGTYQIHRFRPRVDGTPALIERWRREADRFTFWQSITPDNLRRTYGRTAQARLTDPDDATRIFEWLLEEETDERGNLIHYQYAAEDRAGVASTPSEARRSVAYRYPARISWGNTVPFENPDRGGAGAFRFHLIFDYGGHDLADPSLAPSSTWAARQDPFSSFRARFDQRCYRLCRRVLLFHDFATLRNDGAGASVPVVVRSLNFSYEPRPTVTTLTSVQATGWTWTGSAYDTASLPAVTFTYSAPEIARRAGQVEGLEELPQGLDLGRWQVVDLDGEGLSGLLAEQGGSWFYKHNEGEGRFAPAHRLGRRPNISLGEPGLRLVDLDGDGNLDLVRLRPAPAGFQARTAEGDWAPFRSFSSLPVLKADSPDARFVDLDGDGHADILVTVGDHLLYFPSLGSEGYGAPERIALPHDDDRGPPRLLFSRDGAELFLADMTGDGLADLVRIRNGNICYWPNRGYGRFGARVQMSGAPRFDHPDRYDPARVRLADTDGSGPTDLLYIGPEALRIWRNQSGNSFGSVVEVRGFPAGNRPDEVQTIDLLGDGTTCLVWTTPYRKPSQHPLRYLRLFSNGKPWLLTGIDNGLGRTTALSYTPSTQFYLADRRAGRPWATRLPFPVMCLSKVEVRDAVTGWRHVNEYAYHHGYFDGPEREFRGFGMVEQWDSETVSDYDGSGTGPLVGRLAPVRTRTWFHTGAWRAEGSLAAAFAEEYSSAGGLAALAMPSVPTGLSPIELREAHRALKGQMLRQEVYAEDGAGKLAVLYSVAQQTCEVVCLQPAENGEHACFRTTQTETLTAALELDLASGAADPRVSHSIVLETDAYGFPRRTAALSYPRRASTPDTRQEEEKALSIVVTEVDLIHQVDRVGYPGDTAADGVYHLGLPSRTRSYALTGTTAWTDTTLATAAELNATLSDAALVTLTFEETPALATLSRRLLGGEIVQYRADASDEALAFGELGLRALVWQRYALALTPGLVSEVFGALVGAAELAEGGYLDLEADGAAWLPSGRLSYDAAAFYQPTAHIDPWGNTTTLTWDDDALAIVEVTDALGNSTSAEVDYRMLSPRRVTDANGTEQEASFDPIGRVLTTAVRNGTNGDATGEVSGEYTYNTATLPASAHVRLRTEHGGANWQESWAYSDGGGNVVQTKAQAAPGEAPSVIGGTLVWAATDPRFIGTGRTVHDHKGNIVRQYEPFFSTTPSYEDETELVEWGKSISYDYDPIGRNTQVTLPDGATRRYAYTPWSVSVSDEEDTHTGGAHEDTPTTTALDPLGRVYRSTETPDGSAIYETRLALDTQGNVRTVTDPRGNIIQVQRFDLLGRPLFTGSADEGYDGTNAKGETRSLPDVAGQPVRSYRSGGLTLRPVYDALRRRIGLFVNEGTGERLVERSFYGEALSDQPAGTFARGKVVQSFDTAGRISFAYDFRGRTTEQTRTVIDDITTEADWTALDVVESLADIEAATALSLLSAESFTTAATFDALDRPVTQTAPDGSVHTPGYDAGGRLTTVDVNLRGDTTTTAFVTAITYNARGQRASITYGNHTATTYTYDTNRFWLTRLLTERGSSSSHGAASLQDLSYTRDLVGNITEISDAAQETVYFANTQVSPTRAFVYDSLYRLIEATGREKVSQSQSASFYADYAGATGGLPDPTTTALRRYTQAYAYDEAGNFISMAHMPSSGTGWTRHYQTATSNNQLLRTSLPGDDPADPAAYTDAYAYNDRGAMVYLPHLKTGGSTNLTRDFRDQLRKAELDTIGNVAWYAYDAAGQRVRKVWDKGSVIEERIYVGGFEVWRKKNAADEIQEERQTLHVMDDQRRVAMAETLTITGATPVTTPTPRLRYQLDDHLGTATAESDDDGGVITYEEFHPYGTTAWYAEQSAIEVSARRYRYTGMERDEETGLQYHSARYYAPWLARWDRVDPIGLADGGNQLSYVCNCPTGMIDRSGKITDAQLDLRAQTAENLRSSDQARMFNEVYLPARETLARLELPHSYLDDAWSNNTVGYHTDPTRSAATSYRRSILGSVPLPLQYWGDGDTILFPKDGTLIVREFIHEAIHDDLMRHFHDADIKHVFKRESMRLISVGVSRTDAPILVNESFAYFVEGQIQARIFWVEADLQEQVDQYSRGELSREDLINSFAIVARGQNDRLSEVGYLRSVGHAPLALSADSKQWAADRYLGGKYYSSWEQLPGVGHVVGRLDFNIVEEVQRILQ
jgi:RHS repeat-associated protein